MPNLQPHEQKINPPHNHILQMVFTLRILEFNMQTIFNADIHFYTAVCLRGGTVGVDPDIFLADDVGDAAGDGDADEVVQFYVDAVVGFVLLFDVLEVEGEGLGVLEVARGGELLAEGEEFVVVTAVEEHFCRGPQAWLAMRWCNSVMEGLGALEGGGTYCANELDFDACVFQSLAIFWSDCDCPFY